ncbi:MAG: hypothetical protein LIO46_04585 [Clostridiales bacterium]|nr:hypothetical protein [Clostridiales bacterium]
MQDIKLELGKIAGGEYGRITVDGVGKCDGSLKARYLEIDGTFSCTGSVRTEEMHCDGVSDFKGDVYAKELEVDGVLKVAQGCNLEGGVIQCDGVLNVGGQLSADRLKAEGVVVAREIVGDEIDVCSMVRGLSFKKLMGRKDSWADLIEATHIRLSGMAAKQVNGQYIDIGPGCVIENLDCSGTLHIDPAAQVKHITGDYTMA